jgi:hypothetical protein
MDNVVKIINKRTGQQTTAVYAANRQGNFRYHVGGKPISDKEFDRTYVLHQPSLSWKVNTVGLLKEIVNNGGPGVAIMSQPLHIFGCLLAEVAQRATELNDAQLNALMCRLGLYEQSDPYSKGYDQKLTNSTIQKFYNNF